MTQTAKCHPTIRSDTDVQQNIIMKHTKITSLCNIYKYPITNQVTTIVHQEHQYNKFRILLACWIFFAHLARRTALHKTPVPRYMLL